MGWSTCNLFYNHVCIIPRVLITNANRVCIVWSFRLANRQPVVTTEIINIGCMANGEQIPHVKQSRVVRSVIS